MVHGQQEDPRKKAAAPKTPTKPDLEEERTREHPVGDVLCKSEMQDVKAADAKPEASEQLKAWAIHASTIPNIPAHPPCFPVACADGSSKRFSSCCCFLLFLPCF